MFSVSLLHQSSPPHNIHIKEEEEERLGAGERHAWLRPFHLIRHISETCSLCLQADDPVAMTTAPTQAPTATTTTDPEPAPVPEEEEEEEVEECVSALQLVGGQFSSEIRLQVHPGRSPAPDRCIHCSRLRL